MAFDPPRWQGHNWPGQDPDDLDDLDYPDDLEYDIIEQERRHVYYYHHVPFTGLSYPTCLEQDQFDCSHCYFFDEDDCPLRRSRYLRQHIWDIIEPWAAASRFQRQRPQIEDALQQELSAHGRPLNYTVLAQMIRERHPHLAASDRYIVRVLHASPQRFCKVAPGLYTLAGGR